MEDFETFAHSLADASGKILREAFRQPFSITAKEDASPVTEIDKKVESILRLIIKETYATHGIIGEEYQNINEDSEYCWVIDPIDGTRAFIAGAPTFTTLIALLRNGIPIVSVIDQPIIHDRWVGMSERTTLNNQDVAKNSASSTLSNAIISTTSPHYFEQKQLQQFNVLREVCSDCIYGKDGYAYGLLASGHLDLVCEAQLKFYDVAALIPVVQGAGGVITRWSGDAITHGQFDGTVLAAANKTLHTQALELLHNHA